MILLLSGIQSNVKKNDLSSLSSIVSFNTSLLNRIKLKKKRKNSKFSHIYRLFVSRRTFLQQLRMDSPKNLTRIRQKFVTIILCRCSCSCAVHSVRRRFANCDGSAAQVQRIRAIFC